MPPAMISEARGLRLEPHAHRDEDAAELGELEVDGPCVPALHELVKVVETLHRLVGHDDRPHRRRHLAHSLAIVGGARLLPAIDGLAEAEAVARARDGDGLRCGVAGVGVDAEPGLRRGAPDRFEGADVGVDVLAHLDLQGSKAAADPLARELRHARGLPDGDRDVRLQGPRRVSARPEHRAKGLAGAACHRVEHGGLEARARDGTSRKQGGERLFEPASRDEAAGELAPDTVDLAQDVPLVLEGHRREARCLSEARFGATAPPHASLHLDRARRVDPAGGDDERLPQRDRERSRAQLFDTKVAFAQSVHATLS